MQKDPYNGLLQRGEKVTPLRRTVIGIGPELTVFSDVEYCELRLIGRLRAGVPS